MSPLPTLVDRFDDVFADQFGDSLNAFELAAEVQLGGVWTDASGYVYQRNPVSITRGRSNQAATITPSQATMTLNNRDGRWTIRNPTSPWYGSLVQNTPFRFSVPSSVAGIPAYLRLETDTVSFASCPDKAALQITTGILSVRVDCKITDWSSAGLGRIIAAKWGSTTATKAWMLFAATGGSIQFSHNDGTNSWTNFSSLPVPYFGARIAIRVDYNIAAQTVTFFTAPTMAGAWTQLGAVATTGATTQGAGTGQPVQVGNGTTLSFANMTGMSGEVYEAQILSGVTGSTLVADPVFTSQAPGANSFTDAQSNTWTLTGTSELSGRLFRFHGELAQLPKAADPSQHDVYSTATATGLTSRLQIQQTPAQSPMRRAYTRFPASLRLAAYWPAEDGANATQIGQAVGNIPMGNAGLTMASFTGFAASAAIPVMNGGTATALVDPSAVAWTDNVVSFLVAVPSADDTNGAVMARFYTQGTCARVEVVYGTGGFLTLTAYNAAGAVINTSTSGCNLKGNPSIVTITVSAANQNVSALAQNVGATGGSGPVVTFSGTVGAVTGVQFGGGLVTSAMGHFGVAGNAAAVTPLISGPLNAWNGETAATRFARLCGEEGYQCRIIGPPANSVPMGNQTQQTISALLQECETTDQGLMFEPRQVLGLGYITNWALCNQPVLVTADFSQGQIMPGFTPSSDVQLTVNDVTFTGTDGATSRQFLPAGAMSIAAVGRFDTTVTVNPKTDTTIASLAGWYLHTRSADEDRYPVLPFQLARAATPQAVPLADIGSYIQVINPGPWVPTGPVRQIVAGYTETFMPQPLWDIGFNGIPEAPYEVLVLDDPVYGRLDTAGSVLNTGITSAAAAMPVTTTSGPVWTTAGGDFPFDITIGGERITVTDIFGPPPSFLTGQNAGFEGGTGTWAAGANTSVAASSAHSHSGAGSMAMTSAAAGTISAQHTGTPSTGLPCSAGDTIAVSAWFLAATAGRSCEAGVNFFTSAGGFISTLTAPAVTDSTTGWVKSTGTVVAPATSAFAVATAITLSTAAGGEVHYVDDAGIGDVTTGTPSQQTFTVTRAVNGVTKPHVAGEAIDLWFPPYLGLY